MCYKDEQNGKTITEYRTPFKKQTDLVFAVYQDIKMPDPLNLYGDLMKSFGKILDRMGKGSREDGNERRRQITLHSFRRFVKTTISDLGYSDFSEYFIGHSGSKYWTKRMRTKQRFSKRLNYIDISECSAARKTRCRYTNQSRRVGRSKSVVKTA